MRTAHGFLTRQPNLNITPDVNDVNNYCHACQRTYSSKKNYHVHLQNIHKMYLKYLQLDPDSPNYHCHLCRRIFKQRHPFLMHLKVIHKKDVSSLVNKPEKSNQNSLHQQILLITTQIITAILAKDLFPQMDIIGISRKYII